MYNTKNELNIKHVQRPILRAARKRIYKEIALSLTEKAGNAVISLVALVCGVVSVLAAIWLILSIWAKWQ